MDGPAIRQQAHSAATEVSKAAKHLPYGDLTTLTVGVVFGDIGTSPLYAAALPLFLFLRLVSRPAYYAYHPGDEVQLSAEIIPVGLY
jgi:hypothetical protein